MSKVLISALGVGNNDGREYRTAKYFMQDESNAIETPFVTAAIMQLVPIDKVFLIGTSHSMWEEVYRYFANKNGDFVESIYSPLGEKIYDSDYKKNLLKDSDLEPVHKEIKKYLSSLGREGGAKCFLIKYGINEEELIYNTKIFLNLANLIQKDDEIYIDITHSFRSIPVFMFLMLELIQNLHPSIKIADIFYGMLDITKEFSGKTPIISLKILHTLSKWINGIFSFNNFGNGYEIANLIKEYDEKTSISRKIIELSDILNTNVTTDLQSKSSTLLDKISHYDKENLPALFIPYLKSLPEIFNNNLPDYELHLLLSEWYLEHKKYSNALLTLSESFIGFLESIYDSSIEDKVKFHREISGFYKTKIAQMKGKKKNKLKKQFIKLYDVWNEVSQYRNPVAHKDSKNKIKEFSSLKDARLIEKIRKIMKKDFSELPTIIPYPDPETSRKE